MDADALRAMRLRAGMSIRQAARASGFHPSSIVRWESGASTPTEVSAQVYSAALEPETAGVDGRSLRLVREWRGLELRTGRRIAGLSLRAAAAAFGLPVSTLQRWESGGAPPPGVSGRADRLRHSFGSPSLLVRPTKDPCQVILWAAGLRSGDPHRVMTALGTLASLAPRDRESMAASSLLLANALARVGDLARSRSALRLARGAYPLVMEELDSRRVFLITELRCAPRRFLAVQAASRELSFEAPARPWDLWLAFALSMAAWERGDLSALREWGDWVERNAVTNDLGPEDVALLEHLRLLRSVANRWSVERHLTHPPFADPHTEQWRLAHLADLAMGLGMTAVAEECRRRQAISARAFGRRAAITERHPLRLGRGLV